MTVIPITKASGYIKPEGAALPATVLKVAIGSRPLCKVRFDQQQKQRVLGPLEILAEVRERLAENRLSEVVFCGNGDPLADVENTLEILRLVRSEFTDLPLALATSGIHGALSSTRLADAGLNRVELLVNTLKEETITRLYSWIRPGKKTVPLTSAATILAEEQQGCIIACLAAGLDVTIRTTVYPEYNLDEIEAIAARLAVLGISEMILQPCPAQQEAAAPRRPDNKEINQARVLAEQHISTVRIEAPPCTDPCEAAVSSTQYPKPSSQRPNVAVVSGNGMDIDTHLGHARQLLIFGPREDGLTCLLETRSAPSPGGGNNRWKQLADLLDDCFALLTASAGDKPRSILGKAGIRVVLSEENVEGIVDVLYGGGKKKKCRTNPTV